MKLITLASILTLGLSGAAFAADAPDGPTINGGVQMNVEAAEDISAAIGNESTASQELGNINSGNITGDIEMGVAADQDISAAIGNKACASQKVGSIGGKGSDCE